jgi:hypothetical protein
MQPLIHLFSDPVIAGVALLVVVGAGYARMASRRPLASRVRTLRGIWMGAFVVLAMWGMQQERIVQAGATEPGVEASVAVASKGQLRHVTPAQATRQAAVLWVVLGAGLAFALVEMLVLRREPAH